MGVEEALVQVVEGQRSNLWNLLVRLGKVDSTQSPRDLSLVRADAELAGPVSCLRVTGGSGGL